MSRYISAVRAGTAMICGVLSAILCQPIAHAETFESVEPPVCINNLSEQVSFENQKNDRGNLAAGMARRDSEGKPLILRFNYHLAPAGMQHFIDLHECAHHQTGDVDRPHPPRNSPEHLMNESIADCIAILRIRDEFSDAETLFDTIITQLRNDMTQAGFPEISISSRLSNIKNCYADYPPAARFISQILQDRQ